MGFIFALKLLISTIVVLEGYMPTLKPVLLTIHQMQPFRPSAPIQEGTYFHTNTPLFIRKSGAGLYPY